MGDAGLLEAVAQQPVAPLQAIVVRATHVQKDTGELAKIRR